MLLTILHAFVAVHAATCYHAELINIHRALFPQVPTHMIQTLT